jgi:putative membrane protein
VKSLQLDILSLFALGALLGLLSFSKFLKYLMTHFKDVTISFLIGVMLGSLLKIWPWVIIGKWTTIDGKIIPENTSFVLPWNVNDYQMLSDLVYPLCFVLLGLGVIYLINNIFLLNNTNDIDKKF